MSEKDDKKSIASGLSAKTGGPVTASEVERIDPNKYVYRAKGRNGRLLSGIVTKPK